MPFVDTTPVVDVVLHAIEWLQKERPCEYACCIYPTVPFLDARALRKGYDRVFEPDCACSVSVGVFPSPIVSTERFSAVSAGRLSSCAIALDGALWCWGAEWESASGNIDFFHQRLLPHRIGGLPPVHDVSVGVSSICIASVGGVAYCWESNAFAQLGLGTLTPTATPSLVSTGERFRSVSSGIIQSCATTLDGRAMCWGNNSFGQLGVPRPGEHCGDAALECSRQPITVFGEQRFTSVVTGIGSHSCGVNVNTAMLCWGLGSDGQLGDGYTRDRQSLPVGVLAPVP